MRKLHIIISEEFQDERHDVAQLIILDQLKAMRIAPQEQIWVRIVEMERKLDAKLKALGKP